jgi:lysophospholipase L1-like esterase
MSDTEIVEVMIFGDSITYGAWDNNGGWVQKLRQPIDVKNLIDDRVAYFIYNLGVVDDTTDGILKRVEAEMTSRRYANVVQERMAIFAIGLNDSTVLLKKDENRVPKELFAKNVNRLIDIARKHADVVVFIGPTPVDEEKSVPVGWDDDLAYRNSDIKEYDGIIKGICRKRRVLFLEVFDRFMEMEYLSLLEDGLHPNPTGHFVLAQMVRDFLEANKVLDFGIPETHRKHYRKNNTGK